jgi:hypothetical protein
MSMPEREMTLPAPRSGVAICWRADRTPDISHRMAAIGERTEPPLRDFVHRGGVLAVMRFASAKATIIADDPRNNAIALGIDTEPEADGLDRELPHYPFARISAIFDIFPVLPGGSWQAGFFFSL